MIGKRWKEEGKKKRKRAKRKDHGKLESSSGKGGWMED